MALADDTASTSACSYYYCDCEDFCFVYQECKPDCISPDDCMSWCETYLDQEALSCASGYDCSGFKSCVCNWEHLGKYPNSEPSNDEGQCGCNVSNDQSGAILTVLMVAIGGIALLINKGRKTRQK